MVEVRVDSAIADEAEKDEPRAASLFHGVEQEKVWRETAIGDERVDAHVHVDDTAGADIEVADSAILIV